jgi:periplasmic copper chaperone A
LRAPAARVPEMTMDHGVMKMRRMPDGVEIRRPETVVLKPGGFHLMFTDLQARLVKGQSVRTLTSANAGTVDVELAIEGMGAAATTAQMQMITCTCTDDRRHHVATPACAHDYPNLLGA